ncbi:hypothetical protein [Patulibacter sp.]|nr:hypothetical protein [Patulibacter sp.]MDO9410892.1 hypothetical protein [Patulibacter sp.]
MEPRPDAAHHGDVTRTDDPDGHGGAARPTTTTGAGAVATS